LPLWLLLAACHSCCVHSEHNLEGILHLGIL
jgi:hypothetical protein